MGFVLIASPATTSHPDTVPEHTSYLYRVRAVNGSGASADSAADLVTMMAFTNDPLVAGVVVRAVHLAEVRMAIDHVRQLAGLSAGTFTDAAAAGVLVKAIHVSEMRSAIDAALAALALTTTAYTDSSLPGTAIKAMHFQEIRTRLK